MWRIIGIFFSKLISYNDCLLDAINNCKCKWHTLHITICIYDKTFFKLWLFQLRTRTTIWQFVRQVILKCVCLILHLPLCLPSRPVNLQNSLYSIFLNNYPRKLLSLHPHRVEYFWLVHNWIINAFPLMM